MPAPKPFQPETDSVSLIKKAPAFHSALHKWYRKNHRKLPWREKTSLYRTVVSELMCQQTRISTVLPYFERWMKILPDFESLAAASEEKVLKLWEGLGYYRRARNLHKIAKEIVELDEIPATAKEWLPFPGIGPYSAAAITSIAFDSPEAAVDGNVVRVLARLTDCQTVFKNSGTAVRQFQSLAQNLLDPKSPGLHNQAMMELGATHCQPKPDCTDCPVRNFCQARKNGSAESIPAFLPKKLEKLEIVRIWTVHNNRLLLKKTSENASRLAGLCELPTAESLGLSIEQIQKQQKPIFRGKRTITRYSITETFYKIESEKIRTENRSLFWADREEIENLPFSGPHRRWISKLLESEKSGFLLRASTREQLFEIIP